VRVLAEQLACLTVPLKVEMLAQTSVSAMGISRRVQQKGHL